jgi:hypothetical protein
MTGSTLYHVHFKDSGEDHYFGSISAIYQDFSEDQIGISPESLYNFGITLKHPYSNRKVVIKRGEHKRKKGNRKAPKVKSTEPVRQIFNFR